MSSSEEASVLIVGAGLTGLSLALSLVKNGVKVRLIEKEKDYRIGHKGTGIQARTQEIHRLLGMLPDIEKFGNPYPTCRAYGPDGKTPKHSWNIVPYVNPTPDCPYTVGICLGQDTHEALFRSHLEKYGCKVELATEMTGFEPHDDHVEVTITITRDGKTITETKKYKYLVGADGGHSTTRKKMQFTFLGETRAAHLAIGDIEVKGGLSDDFWHFWGDEQTKSCSFRPFEDRTKPFFSFTFTGPDIDCVRAAKDKEYLFNTFHEISNRRDIEFGDIKWISDFRPNIRMVETFGSGRVFIAGDAGHIHSPTGGQGLNTCIQDAFNLGWKLALVDKGLAPSSLLDSYSQERLPVIAAMLNKTSTLLNQVFKHEEGEQGFAFKNTELNQLSITYRGSPIIVDEAHPDASLENTDPYRSGGVNGVHAGDRAPDAPGIVPHHGPGKMRLFDLFGPTYHTVLIFSPTPDLAKDILGIVRRFPVGLFKSVTIIPAGEKFNVKNAEPGTLADHVVEDSAGYAKQSYGFAWEGYPVVVVRPDGSVGAITKGVDGFNKYLAKVFGQ